MAQRDPAKAAGLRQAGQQEARERGRAGREEAASHGRALTMQASTGASASRHWEAFRLTLPPHITARVRWGA
jgi:hypothetical protein